MKQRVIAKVLNTIGIIFMLVMIIMAIPFMVPKLLGYQLYGVLSESMTPAYNVGGVVLVKGEIPEQIAVGDVISFVANSNSDIIMTHRVVEKNEAERTFITKGDANNTVDAEPVNYDRLIGKVVFYIPYMARVSDLLQSASGKSLLIILFAVSLICWLVADILLTKAKQEAQGDLDEDTSMDQVHEKTGKRKGGSRKAVILVGMVLIFVSAAYLLSILFGYHSSSKEYDALKELVMQDTDTGEDREAESESIQALSEEDNEILSNIQKLHGEYPEVIGWILFEDSEISYPIMQGEDNFYYLKHTYQGTKNSAGSIFMEAANEADFSDNHTIIYGHNMKNLSMFGSLRNYRKEGFYQDHAYFKIYSLDQVYRYQIFSFYDVDKNADVYTIGFLPNQDFEEFLDKMVRRSYFDTGIEVNKDDTVVTLSTCSSKGKRFVVHGKRMDE